MREIKKINSDGLLLCELQAKAFENSIDKMESSSEIFIRRFMKSKIAKRLDNQSILDGNIQANDILTLVDENIRIMKCIGLDISTDIFHLPTIYLLHKFTKL